MAQLMPLPLAVSCFSKIQIGFTFLVPAHPGSPGQRAVKRVGIPLRLCSSRTGVPVQSSSCAVLVLVLWSCEQASKVHQRQRGNRVRSYAVGGVRSKFAVCIYKMLHFVIVHFIQGGPKTEVTNSWRWFCQILTDLQNFFTRRFPGKFAVKWLYKGWQWRSVVPYQCQFHFCRHLVGKTLRNVCHCDSA